MKRTLFILLAGALLFSCIRGKKSEKEALVIHEPFSGMNDSTFLFNGNNLDGWEITNFGPQGPVYVSGGEMILVMGDGCTGITWKKEFPKINYKVTLEAKRVAGNDFFCGMTFPVNDDPCSLIIGGWGGTVVGLSSINKMDASENETTTLRVFETNHWYKICLIVKKDTIKALIDDQVVVDFAIGNKSLSIRPEVELSKPFGIASWTTTAALRNIRVEKIN
ncbi:MAG: DUF1080 domain-containing protein [Bacteroidia bacterium]|jgi:hypothetical protein|nr:DUF1080 domain-containing protein [Bacteroidia bacterium]